MGPPTTMISDLLYGCNLTPQCIQGIQRITDNAIVVIKYLTEQRVLGLAENYKSKCGFSELTGFKDFINLTKEHLATCFEFYNNSIRGDRE
jgi:hypothetical protein